MKSIRSTTIALLVGASLSACGGGGSSGSSSNNAGNNYTPPPPPTQPTLGGLWEGQYAASNGVVDSVYMTTDDAGNWAGQIVDPSTGCEILAAGTFAATAQVSGPTAPVGVASNQGYAGSNLFGPAQCAVSTLNVSFTGTLVQQSTLQITLTDSNGDLIPLNLSFDSLYLQPSSLATVTGNWATSDGTTVSITSQGVMSAQDVVTGCVLNGNVSVPNSAVNSYFAQWTFSNCAPQYAGADGVTIKGIGFFNATGGPNGVPAIFVEYLGVNGSNVVFGYNVLAQ
jgi:hypothetical protein